MKRKWSFAAMAGSAILLVCLLFVFFLWDNDPYDYHSGVNNDLDLSKDDELFAFSYFQQGERSIYTLPVTGGTPEPIPNDTGEDQHQPSFNEAGTELLYLSDSPEGISYLNKINLLTLEAAELTSENLHIRDAVFSPDNEKVYFIGIEADDWFAEDMEAAGGFDVYEMDSSGGEPVKLTEEDSYVMSALSIAEDGSTLFYSTTGDEGEVVKAYSLDGSDSYNQLVNKLPSGVYSPALSPNGREFAYTTASDLADGDMYQYELFVLNIESGESERLTEGSMNVDSPVFFHNSDYIAYMEQQNWPQDPPVFELKSMNLQNSEAHEIPMNTSGIEGTSFHPAQLLNAILNPIVFGTLYTILLVSAVMFTGLSGGNVYLPPVIGTVISGLSSAAAFFIVNSNPWIMIAPVAFSIGIFICTAAGFAAAFIWKKTHSKKKLRKAS